MDELEAAVWIALNPPPSLAYHVEEEAIVQQLARAESLIPTVQVTGPVGLGIEFPMGAGTWGALYARAPIGVLATEHFPFQRGLGRKFTVACHRGLGNDGVAFHKAFRAIIDALEVGWGGGPTITGSPTVNPSRLTTVQVMEAACTAARQVGINVTAPRPHAPATLR